MSLRIYFAGSIRGGRDDVQLYRKIIGLLQKYGTVLTEHVADPSLEKTGAKFFCVCVLMCGKTLDFFPGEKEISDEEIHKRDMEWLSESDGESCSSTNYSLSTRVFFNLLHLQCLWLK